VEQLEKLFVAFNSTRCIRNPSGNLRTSRSDFAFNSTRCIRNSQEVQPSWENPCLSTPHGALGTLRHHHVLGKKTAFQLHTVH